jgi:thiol-disulfide isomerase/thioredoxin
MKKIISFIFAFLILFLVQGQGLINIGNNIPTYTLTNVINSPNSQFDISSIKGKPILINFWGTWCSPCIPEMKNLSNLQKVFGEKIQIIAVSNDTEEKLKFYQKNSKTKIWLASEPSQNLWNIFGISTAGHIALFNEEGKLVSITETHNIDSTAIQNLIDNKKINITLNKGDRVLKRNEEPISLDSSTLYSFVIQPQLVGIAPMMRRPNSGTFEKRRISIYNLSSAMILREAYNISVSKRVIYENQQDSIISNEKKYCIDLIVSENDKPNLYSILKSELYNHLPIKGELKKRFIPCYTLRPIKDGNSIIQETSNYENKHSSNSLEFEGKGIAIETFISYLENTLNYPVYNATGLVKKYNIEFSRNNINPLQSTKESLAKLGLEIIKETKEMDVLVISRK